MRVTTDSHRQTFAQGRAWAARVKPGQVLALTGDLGGGKTTFVQGLAKGLGVKAVVNSPTFNIIKRYRSRSNKRLYHIDAYRLTDAAALNDLGFAEMLADPKGIIVIEWAEKVKEMLPSETIWFKFLYKGKNKRIIGVKVPKVKSKGRKKPGTIKPT